MKKIRIFTVLVFILAAAASAFYKVRIRLDSDTTGPVITMDSPTVTVSTGAGEEELLAGVQAEDSRDGGRYGQPAGGKTEQLCGERTKKHNHSGF